MILKVNDTTYIRFNEQTKVSETIDLTILRERKAELEAALAPMIDPTDAELLEWARQNYMSQERLREKEMMESELAKINSVLGEINA